MTTETAKLPVAAHSVSPGLVAVAVVIPTFMEVLDTTIANVALRYIAGGLSAPATDSEWIITCYLAANAIILPISGWLGVRLGRRNYFLGWIAVALVQQVLLEWEQGDDIAGSAWRLRADAKGSSSVRADASRGSREFTRVVTHAGRTPGCF